MKVFISWSGRQSHRVATTLRDWLPSVIQSIEPYVSSEDIDKGARWATDIAKELEQSSFGILCVTQTNITAPWLNFEAGALGKSVDKSRVCPFLFRVRRSEVEGPLLQFQSTVDDPEDLLKLLKSINDACAGEGIEEARLEKAFEVWWPTLERELNAIAADEDTEETLDPRPAPLPNDYFAVVLEEILDLTRTNLKLLRSPGEILPAGYLREVGLVDHRRMRDMPLDHPVWHDLLESFEELAGAATRALFSCPVQDTCSRDLAQAMRRMLRPMEYVVRHAEREPSSLTMQRLRDLRHSIETVIVETVDTADAGE